MTDALRTHGAAAAPAGSDVVAAVREFVDREVLPASRAQRDDDAFLRAVVEGIKRLGLFGTTIPNAYGGLGLDLATHATVMEELARGWLSMAGVLNPHALCAHLLIQSGTEAQRDNFLRRMATGELCAAFSLSEPHAGSDVQAITTAATRGDDGAWEIRGHKRWVNNGLRAGVVFVLAKTDTSAKPAHTGMTCFITEKQPWATENSGPHAGVAIREVIDKMGDRGVETTDLVYEGYRCPPDRILGGEDEGLGRGFAQMIAGMEAGRIGAAALCVGIAQRCLEVALQYAVERTTFGKPIAEHQAVQFKLADMATKVEAARLLTIKAAETKDRGQRADLEAGMAKLFASEAAKEVADDAFRIHGSNGYSKDYEIERLHRDALSLLSAEGPSEIQRMVIGRALVRGMG